MLNTAWIVTGNTLPEVLLTLKIIQMDDKQCKNMTLVMKRKNINNTDCGEKKKEYREISNSLQSPTQTHHLTPSLNPLVYCDPTKEYSGFKGSNTFKETDEHSQQAVTDPNTASTILLHDQ